jgi:hypothetical protein
MVVCGSWNVTGWKFWSLISNKNWLKDPSAILINPMYGGLYCCTAPNCTFCGVLLLIKNVFLIS